MVKVSASRPWDRGFKPYMGQNHDFSYVTSSGWFQEADSRVVYKILFHNQAKLNKLILKHYIRFTTSIS